MKYLKTYLHNLLLMILIFGGMLIFMKIFYPETLSLFPLMGQMVSGFNLWPIVILTLLVSALPRRRR